MECPVFRFALTSASAEAPVDVHRGCAFHDAEEVGNRSPKRVDEKKLKSSHAAKPDTGVPVAWVVFVAVGATREVGGSDPAAATHYMVAP